MIGIGLTMGPPYTSASVHASAPPVGSAEIITLPGEPLPPSVVATHSASDPHETSSKPLKVTGSSSPPPNDVSVQADSPPSGSVVVRMPNAPIPVSTQSPVEGHEMLAEAPTCLAVHALAPPVGSVEVIASPPAVTTHSCSVGQDTPLSSRSATEATLHAPGLPVGSVEVTTLPLRSIATHSLT